MKPVSKSSPLYILALILVFGLAAYLRFIAVVETRIDTPIRGDARLYVIYALNLQHFSVFSRELPQNDEVTPSPDAFVAPGYPALLSLMFDGNHVERSIATVGYVQALLSMLTVLVYFILFSRFLAPSFCLLATLLVAISPHLVNASVYLLTETLFTFSVGLLLLSLDSALRTTRPSLFVLSGLLLGVATLIRPTTLLFVFALGFIFLIVRKTPAANLRNFSILCVAFALVQGSWMLRNLHSTGQLSDPRLTASFIQHGSYPNLMFENSPESYGYPYKFDPENEQIKGNIGLVLDTLWRRAQAAPSEYLAWFLWGKPIQYLAWDLTESVGDSFIYAPLKTPYASHPIFAWSHVLSKALHWPSIVLALGACILAIFSRRTEVGLLILATSAIYFVGFHMIGAPFPRYSIPLRPIIYGLAAAFIQYGWTMRHSLSSGVSYWRPKKELSQNKGRMITGKS